MNDISTRLKDLRLNIGLSQKDVGLWVDATEGAVRSWEKGVAEPSLGRLEALAAKFDCDLKWLIFGEARPGADSSDEILKAKNQVIEAQRKIIELLEARVEEIEKGRQEPASLATNVTELP